jgi:hypothetical protein
VIDQVLADDGNKLKEGAVLVSHGGVHLVYGRGDWGCAFIGVCSVDENLKIFVFFWMWNLL